MECTITKLCLILRYFLVLGLTLSSGWFMSDVWLKFQSKDTAIKQYSEPRSELPTSVLCFDPSVKKSVLDKYNLSMYEFSHMKNLSAQPEPWLEFYKKAHFRLERDFKISIRNHTFLKLGTNVIEDLNITVGLEELFTLWNGFCYKITLSLTPLDLIIFQLTFDKTIQGNDLPQPYLFLTSKANEFGIFGANFIYRNDLYISLYQRETGFEIYGVAKKNLEFKNHCSMKVEENCLHTILNNSKFECEIRCLPILFPEMETLGIPICGTLVDYKCMKLQLHDYLFYSASKICGNPCSVLEYKAKKAFGFKFYDYPKNFYEWRYIFESDLVEVHEEYLVYDFTGFVGSVGGTLGLFVGFSFREIVNLTVDLLEMLCNLT